MFDDKIDICVQKESERVLCGSHLECGQLNNKYKKKTPL